MKRSWFSWAWLVWVVFFLLVEGIAIVRKGRGDTFSEHWWKVFRTGQKVPTWIKILLAVVQLGAGIWLTGHLTFGWWSPEGPEVP